MWRFPKIRYFLGIILILLLLIPLGFQSFHQYISIPNSIVTFQSDDLKQLPKINNSNVEIESIETASNINKSSYLYKMANIPIKKVDVTVLKQPEIIPGGQSIGIQLHTLGVLVVGHHLVQQNINEEKSPAEEANIKVGDIILEMNGKKVRKLDDIKHIVQRAGENKENIIVKLKRGDETIETNLTPKLNKMENKYQIGLYIRDSTTGIGTITFYDKQSRKYGALGHVISDADTKKPLEIFEGKIVPSFVTNIEKGNQGIPGEKQAKFSMKDEQLGTIQKNSPFGVFGQMTKSPPHEQKPIPIAFASEVKKGPAHILTVIEGDKVEKFDIEIINSIPQSYPATKGLIIKVTDERLLEKTGGIVQGMSGSPIIQNDKLVGAVTHVFVNDPTSGYGVHIEWMLQEADIPIYENTIQAAL